MSEKSVTKKWTILISIWATTSLAIYSLIAVNMHQNQSFRMECMSLGGDYSYRACFVNGRPEE